MVGTVGQLAISPALSKKVGKQVRAAMRAADPRVLQADVANWLGVSQGAVWKRLEGQTSWTIGELVIVAHELGAPVNDDTVEALLAQIEALVSTLLEGIEKLAA